MSEQQRLKLIELCAKVVKSESLSDKDVRNDAELGHKEEAESYNAAIRHAEDAVLGLMSQTLSWDGDEWVVRR